MYTHITDRSKLDEIVAIKPETKESWTRLQDLERLHYHRSDVVLLNDTRSGREYTLSVTAFGFSGSLWILDILPEESFEEVMGIAERMRANALKYPAAKKLLTD